MNAIAISQVPDTDIHFLPGTYFWRAQAKDSIVVRVIFAPNCKIEVGIWWNNASKFPDVRLYVGLYKNSVEFGELTGSGFDSPLHQKGFGTLAVNTAIQVLQQVYPSGFRVEGTLLYTQESDLNEERQQELANLRRAFWTKFGLKTILAGIDNTQIFMRGVIGKLNTQQTGIIYHQFPRFVPLQWLEQENRQRLCCLL